MRSVCSAASIFCRLLGSEISLTNFSVYLNFTVGYVNVSVTSSDVNICFSVLKAFVCSSVKSIVIFTDCDAATRP